MKSVRKLLTIYPVTFPKLLNHLSTEKFIVSASPSESKMREVGGRVFTRVNWESMNAEG